MSQTITPTEQDLRQRTDEAVNRMADSAHSQIDRAADAAAQGVHKAVDQVAGVALEAAERLSSKTSEWRATPEKYIADARECVRVHPLASVGFAAVAGYLLAKLLR